MSPRDKQIQRDKNKIYNNIEEQEDDYVAQSKARQEILRGLVVSLDYDIDPELVLEKKV